MTSLRAEQILPKTGLANWNPYDGHIIRKDSPESRFCVCVFVEKGVGRVEVFGLNENAFICRKRNLFLFPYIKYEQHI